MRCGCSLTAVCVCVSPQGILCVFDPPREDAKHTIKLARANMVEVKMITGDQAAIAKETCRMLGLGTNVHTRTHTRHCHTRSPQSSLLCVCVCVCRS